MEIPRIQKELCSILSLKINDLRTDKDDHCDDNDDYDHDYNNGDVLYLVNDNDDGDDENCDDYDE